MRERLWIRKGGFLGLLLCLGLLLGAGRAYAQEGSVTLQLPSKAAGTELTLYAVADYDGSGYVFCDDFANSGFSFDNLNDAAQAQEAAETLASYAAEKEIAGTAKTADDSGTLTFSGLTPALYLMAQTGGEEQLLISPALIPVPYSASDGSGWIYDAVIAPKYRFPGGAVILLKTDDSGTALQGAVFVLQQKVYTADEETGETQYETGSDESGAYYWKEFGKELTTNASGQIAVTDLPEGDYRFVEKETPAGHILEEGPYTFSVTEAGTVEIRDGVYTQKSGAVVSLSVQNARTRVLVYKTDAAGNAVAGAKLVVKDENGKVLTGDDGAPLYAITTTDTPAELTGLPAGNYYLSETEAPEGYERAADVAFTVDGTSDTAVVITMIDEKTPESETQTETATEKQTETQSETATEKQTETQSETATEKQTETQSETATEKQTETQSETATEKQTETQSETATETETETQSETATETETETQSETATETQTETQTGETVVSLAVTKTLYDFSGLKLMAQDGTFYVALFSDEERTQRVSDVKELHYAGSSSSTVTFEGLDPDTAYYVGETDSSGVLLTSGVVGDVVYAPEYPDGYRVTPSASAAFSFRNVFADLPQGYYYSGLITLTKRVLRGAELYDSDGVYYAALFEDAAFTQRLGDVVELSMEGSSVISVEVEVAAGDTQTSSVTYYVTETDKDGNPLHNGENLGFEMTVSQEKVTLTPTDSQAEVIITNKFDEEETETETAPGTGKEQETSTGTPSTEQSESSRTGTNVRTGDNTPILHYLILGLAAAAVFAGGMWKRLHRNSGEKE